LMFFGAGNAMHICDTKEINGIHGLLKSLPWSGGIWLAGAIAITGAPPFALFLSEFTILRAGMHSWNIWIACTMAILLILIFCGFLNHFRQMVFSQHEDYETAPVKLSKWCVAPMFIAFIPLLILGVWWPEAIWNYFMHIVTQLGIQL
jgi:hydrogenase-4 component F